MPAVNRSRLLALSEKEFKGESTAPTPKPASSRFRAIRLTWPSSTPAGTRSAVLQRAWQPCCCAKPHGSSIAARMPT